MSTSTSNTRFDIFLADDDADDRLLFEEAVSEVRKDAKLTMVKNGVQLMGVLKDLTPPPPNVIFLDLNMPLKNGFECLDEIRANKAYKDIPVVIFSTSSQKEAVDKVYKKGADYYLCKPDSFQKLKNLLNMVFNFNLSSVKSKPTREEFLLSA